MRARKKEVCSLLHAMQVCCALVGDGRQYKMEARLHFVLRTLRTRHSPSPPRLPQARLADVKKKRREERRTPRRFNCCTTDDLTRTAISTELKTHKRAPQLSSIRPRPPHPMNASGDSQTPLNLSAAGQAFEAVVALRRLRNKQQIQAIVGVPAVPTGTPLKRLRSRPAAPLADAVRRSARHTLRAMPTEGQLAAHVSGYSRYDEHGSAGMYARSCP